MLVYMLMNSWLSFYAIQRKQSNLAKYSSVHVLLCVCVCVCVYVHVCLWVWASIHIHGVSDITMKRLWRISNVDDGWSLLSSVSIRTFILVRCHPSVTVLIPQVCSKWCTLTLSPDLALPQSCIKLILYTNTLSRSMLYQDTHYSLPPLCSVWNLQPWDHSNEHRELHLGRDGRQQYGIARLCTWPCTGNCSGGCSSKKKMQHVWRVGESRHW